MLPVNAEIFLNRAPVDIYELIYSRGMKLALFDDILCFSLLATLSYPAPSAFSVNPSLPSQTQRHSVLQTASIINVEVINFAFSCVLAVMLNPKQVLNAIISLSLEPINHLLFCASGSILKLHTHIYVLASILETLFLQRLMNIMNIYAKGKRVNKNCMGSETS